MNPESKCIKIENMSTGYGKKKILFDINAVFPAGKMTVILGENGSGKTTLLRAMAGLLKYEGSIKVDDLEIKDLTPRQTAEKIALLAQTNSAYFSFTVEETVRMGRYRFHKGIFDTFNEEDEKCVNECLKECGIEDIRGERIKELSGGQLQRVYIAQMYAQQSDYIFLDEPTNHLDLKHRFRLEEALKASKQSTIAVYHDIRSAFDIADNIVLLKNGRIMAFDKPENLLSNEILNETFEMDMKAYLKR